MARTMAALPAGTRLTDYISLGVITSAFPEKAIRAVLTRSGKGSIRERELPAHVVMYYVIAQALFMQVSQREVLRCLLEGVWQIAISWDTNCGSKRKQPVRNCFGAGRNICVWSASKNWLTVRI